MGMPIFKKQGKMRVPVKAWTDDVEKGAWEQAENVAQMPFVFKHVALMPDVHRGYGVTIGSVVAMKGAVMPSAVGVDIGCGMIAEEFYIPGVEKEHQIDWVRDNAVKIRQEIEAVVPIGKGMGNKNITTSVASWDGWNRYDSGKAEGKISSKIDEHLRNIGMSQLGSLGSGNHFIELCGDLDGKLWVMLHSGSRGIGNKVAQRHIEDANDLMEAAFIELPDKELAYFWEGTKAYQDYMNDISWIQQYAYQNRVEMINRVFEKLSSLAPGGTLPGKYSVNCHHNYAEMEHHFGRNVLVARKGAVRARKGDMGIIPGSMGTKSYIVRGLGEPQSFTSCSHGAGRVMSRKEARRRFTAQDLADQTQGIECPKDESRVDEIPGAYKDISKVMDNQSDLVSVVAELKQAICIKG